MSPTVVVEDSISLPQTNALHLLHGCIPNFIQFVVAIHESSTNKRLAQFSWMRPCEHIPLNIASYSAFSRKRRNQKASRGSHAAPGTYPASAVQIPRAAVCDFLPLRLCDEMGICGIRPFFSRPHAIGHRWMYSCVYLVDVTLGCIPNAVGAPLCAPANQRPAPNPRLPHVQTHPCEKNKKTACFHMQSYVLNIVRTKISRA